MTTPRRASKRLYFLLALGALCGFLLVVALRPTPLPVETGAVHVAPLAITVSEEGKTRIPDRYILRAPVAGFLHRPEVRAGEAVRAGQRLATLSPQASGLLSLRSKAEAQARVQAALAAVETRRAQFLRAQAALDLARKHFTRIDTLLQRGAVSRHAWDEAENRVHLARREMTAADFAQRTAEYEVEHARSALVAGTSPDMETDIPLRAPIDGVVLHLYEENARLVGPDIPLMEIGDPRDMEIEIEMLSNDAVGIAPGAEVLVDHWGGEQPLRGRVVLVERGAFTKVSAIGVEEQRVKVRAEFVDRPPAGLELGDRFGVHASVVTWKAPAVRQLPAGALFRRGNRWMVFVVEDGLARLKSVDIGRQNGLAAEIRSGLAVGERVIVHPPATLEDGTRVEPIPSPPEDKT